MVTRVVHFTAVLEQVFEFVTEVSDEEDDKATTQCSSYEAVVYLLETNQHIEDDDTQESARGLEKRTEQGAWELYEIQRDGRNAVLDEQDKLQRERRKSSTTPEMAMLRIAEAYKAVTGKSQQAAHAMALRDAEVVRKYIEIDRDNNKKEISQPPISPKALDSKTKLTSPLKSPGRRTVVPWDRKASMPLMDTKDEVEIKERVESQPIEKELMADAAAKALDARKKQDEQPQQQQSDVATVTLKKAGVTTKTKRKKSMKSNRDKKEKSRSTSSSTLDSTASNSNTRHQKKLAKKKSKDEKIAKKKLEDEIRELEKRIARKEAAKAKRTAEQLSSCFEEKTNQNAPVDKSPSSASRKPSVRKPRENSSKNLTEQTVTKTVPPTVGVSRQTSFRATMLSKHLSFRHRTQAPSEKEQEKSNKTCIDDPLSHSCSDLSTSVLTSSSELSNSSIDVSGIEDNPLGGFIADEDDELAPIESPKRSLFSRFRRKKDAVPRKSRHSQMGLEASCHF